MFSLSIMIIIYNLHHILLPTLPSCFFTSNFPTIFSLRRYVSTVIQKRCYFQGNKFAPDVQDFKNILSPKHGISFSTNFKTFPGKVSLCYLSKSDDFLGQRIF